jgi:protein-tyrosine phosphatase
MKRRILLAAALSTPFAARAASLPPGRSLGLKSVPNLRDIGGYPAAGNRAVRQGIAFRSEKLHPVAPADQPRLAALGLSQVFDLRTAAERAAKPDQLPPGVQDIWLDVLGTAPNGLPRNIMALISAPKQANAQLGGGKMDPLVAGLYRQFVTLHSARRAYGALFTQLSTGTAPQLYHCTAGKDRTGWATAALLTLLGVPRELVYQDYLKTNDYILPEYQPVITKFDSGGGDPDIMSAIFAARPEYLDAAFAQVNASYGSIPAYFTHGLGVDAAGQARLRARLLTPA